jgi:uncharacterized protein (TIGR03000 family)
MVRQGRWRGALAALVAGLLASAARPAQAQYPHSGYSGVYQGGYSGGTSRGYTGVFVGGYSGGTSRGFTGTYVGGPAHPGYSSYPGYPHLFLAPEEGDNFYVAAPREKNAVSVAVRVPFDADVWFEGRKTTQTGVVRDFESPPLSAGEKYLYHVRARWSEQGRMIDQTRTIPVQAGARVRVDFLAPAKDKAAKAGTAQNR